MAHNEAKTCPHLIWGTTSDVKKVLGTLAFETVISPQIFFTYENLDFWATNGVKGQLLNLKGQVSQLFG